MAVRPQHMIRPDVLPGPHTRHWESSTRAFRLALVMVLVDLVAIAAGFGMGAVLADALRISTGIGQGVAWRTMAERSHEIMALSGLMIGIFAFGGLYRRSGWEFDETRKLVAGIALVALFDAALQFLTRDHSSRLWFLTAYPTIALSVIIFRMSLRTVPSMRTAMTSHLVLLGTGTAPELLVNQLRESRSGPVKLLRSVGLSQIEGREPETLERMLERLARHAGIPDHRVLTVVSPGPGEDERAQNAIAMLNAAGRAYSIVLPFDDLARNGLSLHKVVGSDMVMAEIQPPGWSLPAKLLKRGVDFAGALLAISLLSPMLLVISALLSLSGPVFFMQPRVGRGGSRFNCIKFRSMRPDAQERLQSLLASDPVARAEWQTHQKLTHDPRITPLGAFLRRTSLDELPQLFNVLMGEMSFVGPRPIIAPEVPGYHGDKAYFESDDIAYYFAVTPGITGLWQVSGRASTTHDERVRLDRWYARNWSFWLDVVILFKTFRVVLKGSGSH
ncbi:sugar transferase [Rhodobacteraceae bacterium NNCM2]|nr:sugar transferase [Coraliihabitans acroporae]